jgi:hypothetical protein
MYPTSSFIFSITANDIDGTTLICLMDDDAEFHAMFPKSGHRLHLKRVVRSFQANHPTPKVEEVYVDGTNVPQALHVKIEENLVS